MVGVLITLLFAIGAMGVGQFLLGRWTNQLDPAEALGTHGLAGLGALGLLTLPLGLMPDGLRWGVYVVGAVAVAGYVPVVKAFGAGAFKLAKPDGPRLLFIFAIAIAGLFALVGTLAPSDMLDWDSLAYHLAVPKIWMQSGQIHYIPFIHQSNFPFTVENLFIWGLTWGGQSGAKAFTLAFFVFGLVAVFGFARKRYGEMAGWWAALVLATVPVVMWESGTGYIDVPQGLFGGLGILYAVRFCAGPSSSDEEANQKPFDVYLAGIFLGLSAATKYTGLQTIALVCLVTFAALSIKRRAAEGFRSALVMGAIAMVLAGAWYLKTLAYTGNPVFPFFYEHLGGKNWDQRRASIYRDEQQSFGAGTPETRHNPTELGNAILGLAYQPGRYVNPDQKHGSGTPLGAIGVVVIGAGLLWALSGRAKTFEGSILAVTGLNMLMWFFLSQQSRYAVPLCIPLAVLAGGAIVRLAWGRVLMLLAAVQAAFSLYLVYSQRFVLQSQAALGKVSAEDYQTQTLGFYEAAQEINHEAAGGKVALYDEVFGFLLDVPYVWANPPHSMLIPYDDLTTGPEYALAMKKLGFTHIYISISSVVKPDREFVKRWIGAMGLDGQPVPFSPTERQAMMGNWQDKWMVLLSDAVAERSITPVKAFKHGFLFKVP